MAQRKWVFGHKERHQRKWTELMFAGQLKKKKKKIWDLVFGIFNVKPQDANCNTEPAADRWLVHNSIQSTYYIENQ